MEEQVITRACPAPSIPPVCRLIVPQLTNILSFLLLKTGSKCHRDRLEPCFRPIFQNTGFRILEPAPLGPVGMASLPGNLHQDTTTLGYRSACRARGR